MLQVDGSNVNEADHFFIIKVDDDTIKLASSEANANNGTALDITGAGNSNQTLTYGPSYHRNGTDFYVEAKITNIGKYDYENIAISQIFPSGWEIPAQSKVIKLL